MDGEKDCRGFYIAYGVESRGACHGAGPLVMRAIPMVVTANWEENSRWRSLQGTGPGTYAQFIVHYGLVTADML